MRGISAILVRGWYTGWVVPTRSFLGSTIAKPALLIMASRSIKGMGPQIWNYLPKIFNILNTQHTLITCTWFLFTIRAGYDAGVQQRIIYCFWMGCMGGSNFF